jgi:two-component system CheB/CheR fusion protein
MAKKKSTSGNSRVSTKKTSAKKTSAKKTSPEKKPKAEAQKAPRERLALSAAVHTDVDTDVDTAEKQEEDQVQTDHGQEEDDNPPNLPFPVVGIGASAGGLEAFTEMLHALPAKSGMAFVFVQHLDPKHVSMLTGLLARETTIPVREISDGMRLAPDTVYVIPRNTSMTISGGALHLTPRPEVRGAPMPIDFFLRSLAREQKSRAIGVILSGNASDGTIGLSAIKAAGGITFAQQERSAKYDGMPRSAIAAGCVDFVLKPEEIARELGRIGQHPYIFRADSGASDPLAGTGDGLVRIFALLRTSSGVDFSFYKSSTIKRRILRRMILRKIESLDKYLAHLRANPAEVHALYQDILINVTEFFRDPETFDALKSTVFARMLQDKSRNSTIRIWVPGCSTGEEAYSIAIALLEHLKDRAGEKSIQIFATDISDTALEKARAGIYSENIAQNVSEERLRRFFVKLESGYQISKRIREMCVFARQNVAKDPPFSKLDLISCRNLLIYLGPVLQKQIIPVFHYALKPSGFLLLGSSETIGAFARMFTLVDKKHKIYSRKPAVARLPVDFGISEISPSKPNIRELEDFSEADLQREVDRILLAKYSHPAIIVDDDLNILQFRGHTSQYLEPAGGPASFNLHRMAREGMVADLRQTIKDAHKHRTAVRREGLRVKDEQGFREFNVEVVPMKHPPGRPPRYLVLFEDKSQAPAVKKPPVPTVQKGRPRSPAAIERENVRLNEELSTTRDYLQSIIEEQEASNEELRSANEEIQSSNEELQSTNEELETAKEELQSTNEELNTVNEELQNRNLQLSQAGNDLLNLLSNISIPIVMLGNDLRIRRFTPSTERVLNLIPTDVGRPITDIKFNIDIPDLQEMLLEVIQNLGPKVRELKDFNGRRYSLRVRPYRTEDNKIDGVVMVLVDLDPSRYSAESGFSMEVMPPIDEHVENVLGINSALQENRRQLRAFTAGLISAQEDERRRISRELHDELNQKLALLELNVESLERRLPSKDQGISDQLKIFRQQVTDLSDDLRRMAYQLHPSILDDLGLVVALESYCRDFADREGIPATFKHKNVPAGLKPEVSLALYRIVQEALRNTVKHARARSAFITLIGTADKLTLSVKDTGSGFEIENGGRRGLGLIGMEERTRLAGGIFAIQSKVGKGTEITVEVPLAETRNNL